MSPSRPDLVRVFGRIGALSFGGPAPRDDGPGLAGLPVGKLMRRVATRGGLWLASLAALRADGATFLTDVALVFSKRAVVTLGGVCPVLAYRTRTVVSETGWIDTPRVIDARGPAKTTPGPLILVTQFVVMPADMAQGGTGRALAAWSTALWVTCVPCCLRIYAGAPYVGWLAGQPRRSGALSAITAAVMGAIFNLSVWLAAHLLFAEVATATLGPLLPVWSGFDPLPALSCLGAAAMPIRRGRPLPLVLAVTAAARALAGLAGL